MLSGSLKSESTYRMTKALRSTRVLTPAGLAPATVIVNVTAVNQPVQITPPPASEVTLLPASQLGSL